MDNKYQEALNNLKGYYYIDDEYYSKYYPYRKSKSYTENIDAIQELIDNNKNLLKAYNLACDVIAHTNNKMTPSEIKDCKEDWKKFLLEVNEEEFYKGVCFRK